MISAAPATLDLFPLEGISSSDGSSSQSRYQAQPAVGLQDAFLLVDVDPRDAKLHIDAVLVLVVADGPDVAIVAPPLEQFLPQHLHPIAALRVSFHFANTVFVRYANIYFRNNQSNSGYFSSIFDQFATVF